jgi:hypothetical protein
MKNPINYFGGRRKWKRKRIENSVEDIEALKRALIGVIDPRHEAFIMLNAVPEEYLKDLVEYLHILTGLKKINDLRF